MGDWLPANFHFLRPWALWGLVPLLPLIVFAHWREGAGRLAAWRGRIDAHLLAALTVGAGRRWGLRPIHTLALALALGCLGLAGPAWQREPMPLVEDRAPLVVILDLGACSGCFADAAGAGQAQAAGSAGTSAGRPHRAGGLRRPQCSPHPAPRR